VERPIYLVATPAAEGVCVRVLASSPEDYEASFTLTVTGNGNRSVHRASATLRAGEDVVLSTITLGASSPEGWRAAIRVEPLRGEPYEQMLESFT
jgi:hypothetical protein